MKQTALIDPFAAGTCSTNHRVWRNCNYEPSWKLIRHLCKVGVVTRAEASLIIWWKTSLSERLLFLWLSRILPDRMARFLHNKREGRRRARRNQVSKPEDAPSSVLTESTFPLQPIASEQFPASVMFEFSSRKGKKKPKQKKCRCVHCDLFQCWCTQKFWFFIFYVRWYDM